MDGDLVREREHVTPCVRCRTDSAPSAGGESEVGNVVRSGSGSDSGGSVRKSPGVKFGGK